MKKIINTIAFIFITLFATAQDKVVADNNDLMHENGKINVVIAVVLVILLGLFFYVYTLDRKITKLEKENK
jgi:CcmD family protein